MCAYYYSIMFVILLIHCINYIYIVVSEIDSVSGKMKCIIVTR